MIDFKKELFLYAYKTRIPLIATIEIISECNFRCIHCYIDRDCRKNMLTYEQVVDFGNQVLAMGCLYVVLTGGEVFLHPDFKRIYTFFAQKGVAVSVFTNGSLVDADTIELFKKFPPRVVEITMYGFNKPTYQQVTKTKYYDAVKTNVLALKRNGIHVLLKAFVLQENYCDFDAIRTFASSNSIPFKYDTKIISGRDSIESTHQLDENAAFELERSDVSTVKKYDDETYQYITDWNANDFFRCGAGRSSCWLKSNYKLRACNFLSFLEYDLNEYTVAEAWELFSSYIHKKLSAESDCYNCAYRKHCSYCPAIAYVTTGSNDMCKKNEAYCKRAIARTLNGGYSKKEGVVNET